jgi:hypothetical protein
MVGIISCYLYYDYQLHLLEPRSSADVFDRIFTILFLIVSAVVVTTLFHWFRVRRKITRKSTIEHIVIILLAIFSVVTFYFNVEAAREAFYEPITPRPVNQFNSFRIIELHDELSLP